MKRSPMIRRTPLTSGAGLDRRQPLTRGAGPRRSGTVAPRRKGGPRRGRLVLDPADRQALRQAAYDRAGGACEAGVAPACPGKIARDAFEWHHRKLRSQGGDDTIENSLAVCAACHGWVHGHIAAAKRAGHIVPSWANPADYAVVLPDGRVVRFRADNQYDEVFPAPDEEDDACPQ